MHNPDTDEEATYQTAVESHGEDDFEEVADGASQTVVMEDEAARSAVRAGQQADTEVFHDSEERLARAKGGPIVNAEVI